MTIPMAVRRQARRASPTDSRGLLLAVSLFGTASGATLPFTGTLSQDAANHYSLSFAVNGINAQVPLANFLLTSGTPLAENSSTPVTVTFPPRDDGLITSSAQTDYLNFSVTASSFTGAGKVDMDNGTIAGPDPDTLEAIVFLSSGESYYVTLGGAYTAPANPLGDSTNAGLYLGLPNGSILADVLVFRGDAYAVGL